MQSSALSAAARNRSQPCASVLVSRFSRDASITTCSSSSTGSGSPQQLNGRTARGEAAKLARSAAFLAAASRPAAQTAVIVSAFEQPESTVTSNTLSSGGLDRRQSGGQRQQQQQGLASSNAAGPTSFWEERGRADVLLNPLLHGPPTGARGTGDGVLGTHEASDALEQRRTSSSAASTSTYASFEQMLGTTGSTGGSGTAALPAGRRSGRLGPGAQYSRGIAQPVDRLTAWNEGVDYTLGQQMTIHHLEGVYDVVPFWVAVRQEGGPRSGARILLSPCPVSDALVSELDQDGGGKKYYVQGLTFTEAHADAVAHPDGGPWLHYLVAMSGDIAGCAHETMWPNQVFHGTRARFNLRDVADLASFLADPEPHQIAEHLFALQGMAAARGYRKGWVNRMLALRWGPDALQRHGLL